MFNVTEVELEKGGKIFVGFSDKIFGKKVV